MVDRGDRYDWGGRCLNTCSRIFRRRLACLLCFLTLLLPEAYAATVFGAAEGLPSTLVQSLAVDPRGNVWIGSQDGLSSFDGHRFEALRLTRAGQNPDEHAYRLLIDRGQMLVATSSRLLRIDLASRLVQDLPGLGEDLPEAQAFWQDESGGIWIGDSQGRLWYLHDISAALQPLVLKGVPQAPGISAITGNRDKLWLSTAGGVLEVDRQSLQAQLLKPEVPGLVITDPYVQTVALDTHNRLWIGYWNDGLIRLDRNTNTWTWFHPSHGGGAGLSATSIWKVLQFNDQIHVGTNRGIDVFEESCQCFRRLSHPEWDKVDGNGVIVGDLQADQSALWAAVWGRGLVRFNAGDRFFERQVPMDEHTDSLAHPMVYALHVDHRDRLWIGTYGSFVQWVEAGDRPVDERWRMRSLARTGLRTEARFVWTLADLGQGVAIGTGYGLFASDQQRVRTLAPELQSIRSVLQEPNGDLLVAGIRGLYRWDQHELKSIALPKDLPSTILNIMIRHGEELWLGGPQGLARLDRDFRLVQHHGVGNGPQQLPGPVVWAMKEAPDGTVWVGTSGGLVAMHGDGPAIRVDRHLWPERRADLSIGSIEFAEPKVLWLGTARGLLRYRADTRELRRFDARDGLISDQFHHSASASDGQRLYFGGAGGLIAFDPRQLPEQTSSLRPSVVKVKIGMRAWQEPTETLRLPDRPPSLQLQLSAFQFDRPERVRFAYRWLPMDAHFSDLGDAHQAVFSDLPSGERTLELRAELDGYAVSRPVLHLQVAYAWYERWWGRLLLAFVVVAGAAAFYLRRVQGIRANAEALRIEVQARTRALQHTSAELAAANARLKDQVETDALTGIRNRHAVLERVAQWHSQGRVLGVLLIDLDYFKRINDQHGHLVGDRVLIQFAHILTECLPEFYCARFGGEEFFAFRETSDLQLLVQAAHQLQASVRRLSVPDDLGGSVQFTVSIGVAVLQSGESVTDLLRRADAAMYRAKAQGRDRVETG